MGLSFHYRPCNIGIIIGTIIGIITKLLKPFWNRLGTERQVPAIVVVVIVFLKIHGTRRPGHRYDNDAGPLNVYHQLHRHCFSFGIVLDTDCVA